MVDEINALLQTLLPPLLVALAVTLVMTRKTIVPAADGRLMQMLDRLQARVDMLEQQVMQLQTWAGRLASQVVGLGGQPVSFAEITEAQDTKIHDIASDKKTLLQLLQTHFSIDEIETLALEIGAKEGSLGAGSIDARAIKLVRYAQAHNKTLDLSFAILRSRPDVVRGDAG